MHTRTVTGILPRPDGTPWADFEVHFTLAPTANAGYAIFPTGTVIATTDAAGTLGVQLATGVPIIVDFHTATATRNGASFVKSPLETIIVPAGTVPISLMELLAQDNKPVPPDLSQIVMEQLMPTLDEKIYEVSLGYLNDLGVDGGSPGSAFDGATIDGGEL